MGVARAWHGRGASPLTKLGRELLWVQVRVRHGGASAHGGGIEECLVLEAVETLGVVLGARILVGKHLVRLAQLLEPLLRLRVVGVLVGVPLACELQVGSLDLRGARSRLDAEKVVEARVLDAAGTRAAARRLLPPQRLAPRLQLHFPLGLRGSHLLLLLSQGVVPPRPRLLVPALATCGAVDGERRLHGAAHYLHSAHHTARHRQSHRSRYSFRHARDQPLRRTLRTSLLRTLADAIDGHCDESSGTRGKAAND